MKALLIIATLLIGVLVIASCQNEQEINFNRYYSAGAAVYQSHCQNCHGDKGQGLAALIPAFTDTAFLRSNKTNLPFYLQNGLKGKITVNNITFDGQMLPANLSPIEIAQVLTYVTNSFGNKAGLIDNDMVAKDLKGCK